MVFCCYSFVFIFVVKVPGMSHWPEASLSLGWARGPPRGRSGHLRLHCCPRNPVPDEWKNVLGTEETQLQLLSLQTEKRMPRKEDCPRSDTRWRLSMIRVSLICAASVTFEDWYVPQTQTTKTQKHN